MSQQQFSPESQSNQQGATNEEAEIHQPQYPYSWSGKLKQGGVPRDELPFNYDPTVTPQDHGAQAPGNANSQSSAQSQPGVQYIPPMSDGDAYEQGYRPYRGYRPYNAYNATQGGQGVPPWARPQPQRRNPMRFGLLILILIVIGLSQTIFAHGGLLLGLAAFAFGSIILSVLFFILLPLIIVLVILGLFMRAFQPRRVRYRSWRRGRWRF